MTVTMAPSVIRAFLDVCERTPDQVALRFGGGEWRYADLAAEVRRWAAALHAWGVAAGDRVALYIDNSQTFLTAYLGVHQAGGIVVLVNTQYRQVELRHILADSGARLCVTDAPRLPELERVLGEAGSIEAVVVADEATAPVGDDVAGPAGAGVVGQVGGSAGGDHTGGGGVAEARKASGAVIVGAAAFLGSAGNGFAAQLPDREAVALLAYTSGTTGRSKGAMLTHGNLAANAWAVTTAWHWTRDDVLLVTLPLFHVHGLCVGMHGTWLTGATAILRPRFDAAEVFELLVQGGPTMFFGVPTMYTRLMAEAQRRAPQRPAPLRLYVSGSAPLSVQTFEEFEQRFGQRILERYGMTETIMNLTNPYEGERRPGTVGGPFPGQEARIVAVETRAPIRDECIGEIQVRGPHVFKGYWQRPNATAEAFDAEGWFSTGDLGWRSADGYYTITGRAKELIITGGYNVYPREVEEVLLTHPDVAEAAVLGLPDAEFGEQVVAAVVPAHPDSVNETELAADLIEYCRSQLASYKKPRQVYLVETLPRNALGKIQKHLLRERLG